MEKTLALPKVEVGVPGPIGPEKSPEGWGGHRQVSIGGVPGDCRARRRNLNSMRNCAVKRVLFVDQRAQPNSNRSQPGLRVRGNQKPLLPHAWQPGAGGDPGDAGLWSRHDLRTMAMTCSKGELIRLPCPSRHPQGGAWARAEGICPGDAMWPARQSDSPRVVGEGAPTSSDRANRRRALQRQLRLFIACFLCT